MVVMQSAIPNCKACTGGETGWSIDATDPYGERGGIGTVHQKKKGRFFGLINDFVFVAGEFLEGFCFPPLITESD